jgi:hypothetical protein
MTSDPDGYPAKRVTSHEENTTLPEIIDQDDFGAI